MCVLCVQFHLHTVHVCWCGTKHLLKHGGCNTIGNAKRCIKLGTECTWLPAIEIDVGGGFGAIDQTRAKRLALGGLNPGNGSLVKIVKRFGRVSGHNVGEKLNVTIVTVKVCWCGRRDQPKVNVPHVMELILSSFHGQQGNKNNKNMAISVMTTNSKTI